MGLLSATRRVVTAAALLIFLQGTVSAQTVAWDPNPEPEVAGYRVYIGTQPKTYTRQVDVGGNTSHTPTGVDWSQPVYFAVQAYTTSGLSSPLSTELAWVPPVVAPTPTSAVLKTVTVTASSPFLKGKPVTWTATATGPSTDPLPLLDVPQGCVAARPGLQHEEYLHLDADVGRPGRTVHGLQVWARSAGSTKDYESWMSAPNFEVTGTPVKLATDVEFPTPPDNPVTFKLTVAEAGSDPLEYKFWIQNPTTNAWEVMRDYARDDEAVWVPETPGRYAMQAWARRVGSNEPYRSVDRDVHRRLPHATAPHRSDRRSWQAVRDR